ncbi:hypothetical protein G8O24_03930 [Bradyrhizobium sp. INPA01-394B]|uniref:DUF3024 domain-containing protein n=1 Tax=Bradyrhizobium campsiandrae TaxID=1729892 RepID=A0ABR7UGW9_9BRAD|nr:hypothetical protein [Bradyrhizobium campsiandrae]MBC9876496.1 hypothetical protein [Bradyrhizobium campsiandrae]MBC9982647.1 hypothetical protein [Bradyrhizobium campsiandrae]
MNAAVRRRIDAAMPAHPNELDSRRIERALRSRQRYRYVSPNVEGVAGGYLIQSPCCSRNIDTEGGVIEIALLHYDGASATWQLLRKDHERGVWVLHSIHQQLASVTDVLNADPERVFWQ